MCGRVQNSMWTGERKAGRWRGRQGRCGCGCSVSGPAQVPASLASETPRVLHSCPAGHDPVCGDSEPTVQGLLRRRGDRSLGPHLRATT